MNGKRLFAASILVALLASTSYVFAQPGGRPPTRYHIETQSGKLTLVPTAQTPSIKNRVAIGVQGKWRVIESNGIPDHRTGAFPNQANPHRIGSQRYVFRVPAEPKVADMITPLGMNNFGVAINGIPFDPGAAEWFHGNPGSGWQYEALSGAVALGLDASHGHVQPTGAYHYHGLPSHLLADLDYETSAHPPVIGWAADGFPIYPVYGYADPDDPKSGVVAMRSSFQLRSGKRPNGPHDPGGTYDGTFLADYIYKKGHGDLDECNGRLCKTLEYPDGTYAYFLTEEWPVVPRNFRGEPSRDFLKRGGPPGGGPGGQGPGGRGRNVQGRRGPPR